VPEETAQNGLSETAASGLAYITIIGIIPILGWLILFVGMLGIFIVWIICVIKAFNGQRFVIPGIGAFAAKQAGL
jgi:uncharacterized membrane protein